MKKSDRLKSGLVVAPQSDACYEGAEVLAMGGNAADALVTAALVQGVTDPHRCGVGGFGCATVYWKERSEAAAFGFHGRVGEKGREDLWSGLLEHAAPDGFGYVIQGRLNDVGYQSIAVPGMLAGLGAIHRRFGSVAWEDLVERAARVAVDGFLVGPHLAEFWRRPGLYGRASTHDRLAHTAYGRQLWLTEAGESYKSGDRVSLPDLACTYRKIAREGPESFYRGALAARMAADLETHGALLTSKDFRDYQVDEEKPLVASYRGYRVLTSPLPGGGTALLEALKLWEETPPGSLGHNTAPYIHRLASVLAAVCHDRLTFQGDPRFGSREAVEFLSDDYLGKLKNALQSGSAVDAESPDTTQLSIVDRHQNCVSFSHSLGYGSGVFTPSLGFMYNNCMSGFDPRPGQVNSIGPGKARSTAIAETILLRGDEPFLVLGSPGGARITAAIVQTIVNVVDYGMSVAEAVLQPRFDGYGDKTLLLGSRFPRKVVEELRNLGWSVVQSPNPFGMVGRVYAIESGGQGKLIAGVDPGEPGAAVRG